MLLLAPPTSHHIDELTSRSEFGTLVGRGISSDMGWDVGFRVTAMTSTASTLVIEVTAASTAISNESALNFVAMFEERASEDEADVDTTLKATFQEKARRVRRRDGVLVTVKCLMLDSVTLIAVASVDLRSILSVLVGGLLAARVRAMSTATVEVVVGASVGT
jgi:hypothetical protein